MPHENVFVSNHIHVEGPIPGPYSLLTVASAAHRADGTLVSTFTVNLRELPGATIHPIALRSWRGRADDWLTTRRAPRPPAAATSAYVRWVDALPGPATFVADPEAQDHVFLYWYVQRFAGHWPFAATSTDPQVRDALPDATVCPLPGCRDGVARTA